MRRALTGLATFLVLSSVRADRGCASFPNGAGRFRLARGLAWLLVLPAILPAVAPGCSWARAPGGYSAERGLLVSTVRAPLDETWAAARAALDALHLRPHDLERDSFSALILGDTAEGEEVRVALRTVTASTTEITIRIVGSRDREQVEQIRDAILEHL